MPYFSMKLLTLSQSGSLPVSRAKNIRSFVYVVTTHHLVLNFTVNDEAAILPLRLSYAAARVQHRAGFLVRHQTTVMYYVLLAAGVKPVFGDSQFAKASLTAGCRNRPVQLNEFRDACIHFPAPVVWLPNHAVERISSTTQAACSKLIARMWKLNFRPSSSR